MGIDTLINQEDFKVMNEKEREERKVLARKAFANLENDECLKGIIKDYEKSKSSSMMFNCGPRKCYICNIGYYGSKVICPDCTTVYENEQLFWKQGKIM
jgi:hypothetical protein